MANNTEAIGRLLADSTLLKGERGLLRKQDEVPQEAPKQISQPTAAIAHDSKVVAAVLLTLLDERLQASDAEMAHLGSAAEADPLPLPSRVNARYAEDGLSFVGDMAHSEDVAAAAVPPPQTAVPAASPELQTFMQRFAALALGKPEAGEATVRGGRGAGASDRLLSGEAVNRIAAAAVLLVCLGVVIASLLSH